MATLFERARQGDTAATAEMLRLARAFSRRMCSGGSPRSLPELDPEDVAQEVLCRLLQSGADQYSGAGSESSYIYTVVKCTVIQMARSAERRRQREDSVAAHASPATPTPERRLDLQQILEKLDPVCRALIERILFRDEPYAMIAEELKLNESSIRSRMHRCLKRARDLAGEKSS